MAKSKSTRRSKSRKLTSAVAYIRRSSAKQEESLDAQKAQLTKWAKPQGIEIVDWYVDDAISGWKFDERKDFQRMLRAAKRGDFQLIVTQDQDRFSRMEPHRTIRYLSELYDAGVTVRTIHQGDLAIDQLAPLILTTVNAHAKEQYVRDLANKTAPQVRKFAERGDWVTGDAPYGYIVSKEVPGFEGRPRLALGDACEIETVKWMFQSASRGAGIQTIAVQLNEEKIRTKRGGLWTTSSVSKILHNRRYTGTFIWGEDHRAKFVQRDDDDLIIIEKNHPAIVTAATFERVQRQLQLNRRHQPTKPGASYPFAGIIHCERCGSKMGGRTRRSKVYYRCRCFEETKTKCVPNTADQAQVRQLVAAGLHDHFTKKSKIKQMEVKLLKAAGLDHEEDRISASQVKAELAELDQQLTRLRRRTGTAPDDVYDELMTQIQEVKSQQRQLEGILDHAETPTAVLKQRVKEEIQETLKSYQDLQSVLTDGSDEDLRVALLDVVSRIDCYSEEEVMREGLTRKVWKLKRVRITLRTSLEEAVEIRRPWGSGNSPDDPSGRPPGSSAVGTETPRRSDNVEPQYQVGKTAETLVSKAQIVLELRVVA